MPIAANVLLMLLAVAAGVIDASALQRRRPDLTVTTALSRARHVWCVCALLPVVLASCVPFLLRPDWAWHLPLWLERDYVSIAAGAAIIVIGFVFGFGGAVAFSTRHPERRALVLAGLVSIAAVELAQYQFTRPVAPDLAAEDRILGVTLQTHPATCAAAAGATIARSLGIEATERSMAERFGTNVLGTSSAQVIRGMEDLGVACRKVEIVGSDVSRVCAPAILIVDHPATGPESHAVALLGTVGGRADVADPAQGRIRLAPAELRRIWHGRAIECRRTR